DPCLLNVLLNTGYDARFTIRQCVNIDLEGIFEKAINEHRLLGRGLYGTSHIPSQARFIVDDHHCAAPEYIARPYKDRITDRGCPPSSFIKSDRSPIYGLRDIQVCEQLAKSLPVLGEVDRFRAGSYDRHACAMKPHRQVERSLPSELDNHPIGSLALDDVH